MSSKESSCEKSACLDSNRCQFRTTFNHITDSIDVRTGSAFIVTTDHFTTPTHTHTHSDTHTDIQTVVDTQMHAHIDIVTDKHTETDIEP